MGNLNSIFGCWDNSDDSEDKVVPEEQRVGESPRDPMYYLESPRKDQRRVEILPTIFEER